MVCKALNRCVECGFCLDCHGDIPCPMTGGAHFPLKPELAARKAPKAAKGVKGSRKQEGKGPRAEETLCPFPVQLSFFN